MEINDQSQRLKHADESIFQLAALQPLLTRGGRSRKNSGVSYIPIEPTHNHLIEMDGPPQPSSPANSFHKKTLKLNAWDENLGHSSDEEDSSMPELQLDPEHPRNKRTVKFEDENIPEVIQKAKLHKKDPEYSLIDETHLNEAPHEETTTNSLVRSELGDGEAKLIELAKIAREQLPKMVIGDILAKTRESESWKSFTATEETGGANRVIAGSLVRELGTPAQAELHMLAVRPSNQGKGLGHLILDRLLRQYEYLVVMAPPGTIRFFKKVGFREANPSEQHLRLNFDMISEMGYRCRLLISGSEPEQPAIITTLFVDDLTDPLLTPAVTSTVKPNPIIAPCPVEHTYNPVKRQRLAKTPTPHSQSLLGQSDKFGKFPLPYNIQSLRELVAIATVEKNPFVQQLKERVISFFANPATLSSHTAKNCWYFQSAKQFLKQVHRTRQMAIENYRHHLVLQVGCGCPLPKAWVHRQKYKILRTLSAFSEEFDRPRKTMPAPKPKAAARFIRPEFAQAMTKESDQFVMKMKARVVGFFSNPAVCVSHKDTLDCNYMRSAKDFLRKRHGSKKAAIEAFRLQIIPQEDCGCTHYKFWLVQKKCSMNKVLSQFLAEHETPRKRDLKLIEKTEKTIQSKQ